MQTLQAQRDHYREIRMRLDPTRGETRPRPMLVPTPVYLPAVDLPAPEPELIQADPISIEEMDDVIARCAKPMTAMILCVVARHFELTTSEIVYRSRNHNVVYPRHIALYLCKRMTKLSLTSIGRRVDDRDHTTVLNGINRIKEALSAGDQKTIRHIYEIVTALATEIADFNERDAHHA